LRTGHLPEVPRKLKFGLFANLLVRAQGVISDVELIRWQEPDHMNEARQRADGISAAAESEEKDAIALLIVLGKKSVSAENFGVEAVSGCQFEHAFGILRQSRPRIVGADRADSRVVIDTLIVVLMHNAKEFQHIR